MPRHRHVTATTLRRHRHCHATATATPLRRHRHATATPPPRHRHATATSSPRHRHATAASSPRHCHATATPLRHSHTADVPRVVHARAQMPDSAAGRWLAGLGNPHSKTAVDHAQDDHAAAAAAESCASGVSKAKATGVGAPSTGSVPGPYRVRAGDDCATLRCEEERVGRD